MPIPQEPPRSRAEAVQYLADMCADESLPPDLRVKSCAIVVQWFMREEENNADAC
jgi:hypothetical protein